MTDKVFVDTNILVYACDRSEAQKQLTALQVLNQLAITRTGVISTQVLAEFFVAVTNERKFAAPLSAADAYEYIQDYLYSWEVVDLTGLVVLEAARGVRDYQFSFWDAQIWATAKLNQILVVYSEDFNVGAAIEGVRFQNPFI
jgi:predicted nucleic acid-binding protein